MSWISVGVAAVGVGTAIYSNVQANKREKAAQRRLDSLSKEGVPTYAPTDQQKQYEAAVMSGFLNPRGITGAQRAAATDATNRAVSTSLYNARGMGNNRVLANALTPTITANANNLELLDARIKNDNRNRMLGAYGGVANTSQNIANMNVNNAYNLRMNRERALGGAILQNQAYQQQQLNNFSSDLMGAGANMAAYKYANQSGSNPSYTTTRTRNTGAGYTNNANPDYISMWDY